MKQTTLWHEVWEMRCLGVSAPASRKKDMHINFSWINYRRAMPMFLMGLCAWGTLFSSAAAFAGQGAAGSKRDESPLQRQGAREERMREERSTQPLSRPTQPVQQQPMQGMDSNRRNARMSLEDRRALRRQIDQAGHEIYLPNR